jgi:predicted dehydrogenase
MESVSRRDFVRAAAAASLLTARAYSQVAGAAERLRIGVIGCGGMATYHMETLLKMRESDHVEIVAVCDVYQKRLDAAAKLTGATPHRDYRRLLDRKDIDYVLIATPEHWHARMTTDAAAAGKHIYCEKPMTRTAEEARKVVAAVDRSGVRMQVGVLGMSDDSYEAAAKYVKEGALGDVLIAQIDYSRNHKDDFMTGEIDPDARPGENLDWNAWLGSAPKRAWDPERYCNWRRYWDYSTGIASDLFVHRVTRIIKALDLTFPERATGAGGKWCFRQSRAEVPDTFNIMLDYPGGPTVLLVSSMGNDTRVEHALRGHKATLTFTPSGFTIRPQSLYAKEMNEITHKKSGGESIELHHRNLAGAIRANEPLKCDCRLGYHGVVAVDMGVRAWREHRHMAWDKTRERIVKA